MEDRIITLATEAATRAIQTRRDLHQHPELGFTEFRTTSLIARRCADLGYAVKVGPEVVKTEARLGLPPAEVLEEAYQRAEAEGGDPEFLPHTRGGFTGVLAELKTGRPGPTVAMRFDIDALPILESDSPEHFPAAQGFRSVHEGVMHACGHDAHAAIGLGVAEVLAGIKEQLVGTYRLLFQPAEEGCRGAYAMVEAGLLDDVDYLISSHISIGVPSGHLYTMVGGYLASTKIDATYKGAPSHAGSSPHVGRNALMGATQAVQALYGIARHGEGMSRVNVGVLRAGSGRNVIPDNAFMMIEVRGETDEVEAYMRRRARQILEGTAAAHELEVEIQVAGRAGTLTCDPELSTLVAEEARKIPGLQVHDELFMSGGSEDISVMATRVRSQGGKATFMALGSDTPTGHHTRTFDIQEKDFLGGIAAFALAAARLSKEA